MIVRIARTRATTSNGCTDDLFTGLSGDGGQFVLQIGTGVESQIAPPPNGWVADLRPFRHLALYTVWDGDRVGVGLMDGWIWSAPTGARRLLSPGPGRLVFDIRTDGTNLVWLEMATNDHAARVAGELWSSPFATDEGDVQRRRVREVPTTSILAEGKAVGDDHYALLEQREDSTLPQRLHVYRLTDGRHWEVRAPQGIQPGRVLSVDSVEVWYEALASNYARTSLVRQRLSALGEGD
jgi:hypothetical protein